MGSSSSLLGAWDVVLVLGVMCDVVVRQKSGQCYAGNRKRGPGSSSPLLVEA